MQSSEKSFLVIEKTTNGKNREKAWKEVYELEKKEKAFKILWREKENLKKENESLKKDLKKYEEKIFKLKFELDKCKENSPKQESKGSINSLKRIFKYMQIGKSYSKTDLGKELMIKPQEAEQWMKTLIEFKIINIDTDGVHYIRN